MLYDKPVRDLLKHFAGTKSVGEIFTRADLRSWFREHYPKVPETTLDRQTTAATTNIESRKFWSPRPGRDDLFFRIRHGRYA